VSQFLTEERRQTQRRHIDRALSRRRKIPRPPTRKRTKLPSTLAGAEERAPAARVADAVPVVDASHLDGPASGL
jgi:hypothetical protein